MVTRDLAKTQPSKDGGQIGTGYRSDANQTRLDGKAFGTLTVGEVVGDQRPEWFHGHVKGRIHDHDEAAADPKGGDYTRHISRIGDERKGQRGEQGTRQKIGFASTEAVPGPVAVVTDQWLDDHAHYGSDQPEGRQLV